MVKPNTYNNTVNVLRPRMRFSAMIPRRRGDANPNFVRSLYFSPYVGCIKRWSGSAWVPAKWKVNVNGFTTLKKLKIRTSSGNWGEVSSCE